MIDIAAIFKNKGMERESLLEYGFCKEGEIIEIMNLKDAPDEVAAHVETGKVFNSLQNSTPVAISLDASVEMDSQKVGRLVTPTVTKTIKTGGGV